MSLDLLDGPKELRRSRARSRAADRSRRLTRCTRGTNCAPRWPSPSYRARHGRRGAPGRGRARCDTTRYVSGGAPAPAAAAAGAMPRRRHPGPSPGAARIAGRLILAPGYSDRAAGVRGAESAGGGDRRGWQHAAASVGGVLAMAPVRRGSCNAMPVGDGTGTPSFPKHPRLLPVPSRAGLPTFVQVRWWWWARQGSNLRPLACKASALPLSYAPRNGGKLTLPPPR